MHQTFYAFVFGLAFLLAACNNSNSTTSETPADRDDNEQGDPNNQSHDRGTSNGYDDDSSYRQNDHY